MPYLTLQRENHNMNLLGLTKAVLSEAASYTIFENKQQQQKHLAWPRALVVVEHINHRIPSKHATQTAYRELGYTSPIVSLSQKVQKQYK